MKRFSLVVLFLVGAALPSAFAGIGDNITVSGTDGTHFTLTWTATGEVTLSGQAFNFNSANIRWDGTGSWYDPGWGTEPIPAGAHYVELRAMQSSSVVGGPSTLNVGGVTYKIDFPLPKNSTAYPVTYKFFQGTTLIQSVTMNPNEGPSTVHLTGLDSADEVYVVEYTGSVTRNDSGGLVFNPDTQWQVVSHGVPSTGGTAVTDTPAPPTQPPAIDPPTAPTAPPAAPTPTTPPAAPTPTPTVTRNTPHPDPNPTPSGSGGTTKADTEKQTNDLVGALNHVATQVNDTGNGIISAVNNANTKNAEGNTAIVNAINSANAKAAETGAAQISAANKLQSSVDLANTKLEAIRSNTQATTQAVTDLTAYMKTKDQDSNSAASDAAANGQSIMAAKQSQAADAFAAAVPGVGTITSTAQAKPSSVFDIDLPHYGTLHLDPFESELAGFIAWIRAILAFLIAGLLTWWMYGELGGYVFFSSTLAPARGNTVAGSGGQITSAIVAAWTTLVLLALPAAISALWTGAPLLASTGNLNPFTGATSTAAQAGLYLLWGCFPVETLLTALTSMFVVKKAGMQVYFAVAAAIRWAIA